MRQVIESGAESGDGVSIEREQPSTAFRSMPAYGQDNSSFKDQPIEDVDGFMKLGDIKGEFAGAYASSLGGFQADDLTKDGQLAELDINVNSAQMGELRSDHIGAFKALNETTNFRPQLGESTSIVHPQFQEASKAIIHPQFRTNLISSDQMRPVDFGSFEPRDVKSVEIGRPPEPEFISRDDGDELIGIVHLEDDAIGGTTGMDKQFTTGGGGDSLTGEGRPMNSLRYMIGGQMDEDAELIQPVSELDQGFISPDSFSELDQGFIAAAVNGLRSENRFVFEPMKAMTSFGDSSEHLLGQQSNWDVICDVSTALRQAAVMPSFAIVYNNNG